MPGPAEPGEDLAVTNFRRYLRIKTEQPTPDYGKLMALRNFTEEFSKVQGVSL